MNLDKTAAVISSEINRHAYLCGRLKTKTGTEAALLGNELRECEAFISQTLRSAEKRPKPFRPHQTVRIGPNHFQYSNGRGRITRLGLGVADIELTSHTHPVPFSYDILTAEPDDIF